MKKPKIFVFVTSYHPFIGGAEIAVEAITGRLKKRFDFYIVTSRFRRDLPKREIRPEGTIIRIGFGTKLDKYLLILSSFYYRELPSVILGVDISHASVAAALYKFFYPRTHFIFNIQFGESEDHLSSGRAGIIAIMFQFIIGQTDYVTTISSYLLNLAREYGYKGPAAIVPNGVDIKKFTRVSDQVSSRETRQISKPVIITTSRLVYKNGIDILIRAVAEVKKTIPDIQCWIIGDGPERESYKLLIINHQLGANVKLFGSIPNAELPRYLHQADIFVRPSRSEGMGNSFVEALAAGLPIIGTPVGGILDIIENRKTGLFCNPEDPRDLAEKIMRLLQDKNLSADIALQGKKMVVGRFSWDKIAQKYNELLSRFSLYSNEAKPLRILVATPLLPPQIGGPAQYAQHLSEEFLKLGHKVKIVSFGKYLRFPSGIRHLLYWGVLVKHAVKSDLIFALDYTSVGFPAVIVSLIFRKTLVIRIEGDFLWESFVERRRLDVTLKEFYKNPPPLSLKEGLIKWISGWVMRRASKLAFSSEWRRSMIVDAYKIPLERTEIIRNVFPPSANYQLSIINNNRVILWAGRMLYLKNLQRLIRVFASVNASSYELHLVGEGLERKNLERLVREQRAENRIKFFPAMGHRELMKKLVLSTAFVLPSLSDVGPNVVAEAIAALIPVIMTKESGYAEIFRDTVILIDPLDETDLYEKLEKFIKEPAKRTIPRTGFSRPWAAAAKDWLALFQEIA